MSVIERRVGQALLREYGWGTFDPCRGGDPYGLGGWERMAKVALEAANYQGAVEALTQVRDMLAPLLNGEPSVCDAEDVHAVVVRALAAAGGQ